MCLLLWLLRRDHDRVLVNEGMVWAAILFDAVGVFSFTSGWRMHVDEKQALVAAQGAVGFPVGHASAQQVWRGLRSRPTWRVLVYSAENPPRQRSLVLVDAIDGTRRRAPHRGQPRGRLAGRGRDVVIEATT